MIVRPVPDAELYELVEPLRHRDLLIPAGFRFSFSVPRAGWTLTGLTPFHPRVLRAGAVHDRRYGLKEGKRRAADDEMFDILIADGVNRDDALQAWVIVREFGSRVWEDEVDRKEREAREERDRIRVEDAP